jgi:hypothetical protein
VAFVPLTVALVAAVKVFRAPDRRRSWRLTAWAAGLFVSGVGLIAGEAMLRFGR